MTAPGQTTSPAPTADAPPDWASIERDILCPLCDYNLRGLIEPRCPECGHRFQWSEMLARSQWEHPWLFEHRHRRQIPSLLRTFLISQLPRRFWRSVRPVHKPRPIRLVFYWLVLFSLVGLPAIGFRAAGLWEMLKWHTVDLHAYREQLKSYVEKRLDDPDIAAWVKPYGSVDAYVRHTCPVLPSWMELKRALENRPIVVRLAWHVVLGCLLWPWLTLLSLLLFQRSMRQVRVKAIHVMRCAIYSSDTAVLLVVPVTWVLASLVSLTTVSGYAIGGKTIFFHWNVMLVFAAIAAVMGYRLSVAYRTYLGFPHAIGVSVASQVIVMLTLLAMSPWGLLV